MRTEKPSAHTEFSMHTAEQVQAEMSGLLRQLACPVAAGESVKCLIRRAAMRSGLPHNQVKRLWYGEQKGIPAYLADNIREAAAKHDRRLKRSMVEALAVMQALDPDYYRDIVQDVGDLLLSDGDEPRRQGKAD
jgi:uncharacterized protein YbaR (Trm112 family)